MKVGRQTEHDAMIRHQLFERVPITKARGKKVRCQWLDEMKEVVKGSFVRSRLVAMEVAHGARFDTFAGTAPLKCVKIIISRAASIKNVRGQHTRVLALYDISVAFWHALLPEDEPIAMDRLDEVLKKLVVVKVLDRVGPGAAELGQYLKRHIACIVGQGFEWLEDPKHIAAIIRKARTSGKPIQKHWTNWKRWKQSCISKIQGSASTCLVGDLTCSSA